MGNWSREESVRPTWQIAPCFDLPGPLPIYVQYTLLDADPLPVLRRRLRSRPVPDLPSRAGPVSPGTFTPRQAYLAAVWGGGVFGQVTGDRVYLLVDDRRGTEVVAPDGKVVVTTTRTFQAIFADGPAGTKWLVTGAMPRQGRALAWCLEVTAEIGKMVEVALSLDNALDLEEESRPMPET